MIQTATDRSLLEQVLPEYDVRSRHRWLIEAAPDAVWRALDRYDVGRDSSVLVRTLFLLRGLRVPSGTLRDVLTSAGFRVLAERPGEEVVVGITGRFWAVRERDNLEAPADLEAFNAFGRPGWAKAVMSFRVEPRRQGWSRLVTETRVRSVDEEARRRFRAYWTVINTFSGWIRRDFLRAIGRIAERGA